VRLIPRFQDQDIETFLISFGKIAALNNFPRDKYSAVLQAHLTGKALKVFTELTTAECQDYDILKRALLTAYAVVPEVYRKRFRASSKAPIETYSEFAFRLSTQFKRWAESENAYADVNMLQELILMEQFNTHLDTSMRGWLIDQKPQTLSELSRLADQYVAIHQTERFAKGSQNPRRHQFTKNLVRVIPTLRELRHNSPRRLVASHRVRAILRMHRIKPMYIILVSARLLLCVTTVRNQVTSWQRVARD